MIHLISLLCEYGRLILSTSILFIEKSSENLFTSNSFIKFIKMKCDACQEWQIVKGFVSARTNFIFNVN
jgi:ribosomal protein S27E